MSADSKKNISIIGTNGLIFVKFCENCSTSLCLAFRFAFTSTSVASCLPNSSWRGQ